MLLSYRKLSFTTKLFLRTNSQCVTRCLSNIPQRGQILSAAVPLNRNVGSARHLSATKLLSNKTNKWINKPQKDLQEGDKNELSLAAELTMDQSQCQSDSLHEIGANQKFSETFDSALEDLEELTRLVTHEPIFALEASDAVDNTDTLDQSHVSKENAKTVARLPRTTDKVIEYFGSPDPSVPISNVPCHGCGAKLHCCDPGVPGYLPSQKFLSVSKKQLKDILCQRCNLLTIHNIALDAAIGQKDYKLILNEIQKHKALVIILVDVTDLPNSFYKDIKSVIGCNHHIYVVGNKVDLLPKDDAGYLRRVKDAIFRLCHEYGFSKETDIKHVSLISAKTGYGIEDLITWLLNDWRLKGHVYILGCANSGKSTLFNQLLSSDFCRSSAREVIHRATTSVWPGTTLNLLKFPIMNPKPSRLHERAHRLQRGRSDDEEEHMLNAKANSSSERKVPSLMEHIGQTVPTPTQMALNERLSNSMGYVVPTYAYSEKSGNGIDKLEQRTGVQGLIDYVKPKPLPYDDSTFKYWCFDTPGLINQNQIINLLNQEELLLLLAKQTIVPKTYILKPGQVLFVSGVSRIDYVQGKVSIYFTVFTSADIPIHVVNGDDADNFYRTNICTPNLGIPIGNRDRLSSIPSLVGKEFDLEGQGWEISVADVVLSSIGWVSITAGLERHVTLKAYTPGGLGCILRTPAMLKYAVNLRGKRIRGTPAYEISK